ncbi:PIN domain-containing protein [Leptospira sp. FAT2]|uniref:PIN domain-containing protein n=1 Tax=Leptospira sanjuanensis TaxID=2879643 RepID=UPI001EE83480|nr:PIN domain-containing protein [Leptospira sanjuanensis]MCG6166733.1 PIN domain-containing protein [Leptospira sanjuanensis]MCG6192125.1 PIN domain-containing protein [Leptospira sanjuanensis]
MSRILLDSSVWIDYFRDANSPISSKVDELIDNENVYTNDLILAELIPFLKTKKQSKIVAALEVIERLTLEIDWKQIIDYQISNLKNGINKVGIPDLIIAQNAIQNKAILFTLDKHFKLMSKHIKLKVY